MMKLQVYYAPEGDFLEIVGEPKKGYHEDIEDGITVRKEEGTGKIIGYTIQSLSKRSIFGKDFILEVVHSSPPSSTDAQRKAEKHSLDKSSTDPNRQ